MSDALPKIYLVRHGETEWSVSGKHTGTKDIPLTERGKQNATELRGRLAEVQPLQVLCSPLERARQTCELAGFGARMVLDPDLVEWGYGDYEGLTTPEIQKARPGWSLFRDSCPGGETLEDVGRRADRIIARVRSLEGDTILFGHGHAHRILAARWLALPPRSGALFRLGPASVSVLSYEHTVDEPAISLWNDERRP